MEEDMDKEYLNQFQDIHQNHSSHKSMGLEWGQSIC